MDLRAYYTKIRNLESQIEDDYPIVVSQATGDGGKPGQTTEAPRRIAAKLIVEGSARLATPEEAAGHRTRAVEAHRQAQQAAVAANVKIAVLSTAELEQLKSDPRKNQKG